MGAFTSVELPDTVPGIGYTLKHRNAVEQLIRYYCKRAVNKPDGNGVLFTQKDYKIMLNRGKCHDMDKICVSMAYPQLMADYFHRMFNGHHEEAMIEPAQKSKYDWMEMIFDMESTKYTKADKQGGGAYAFASQYKQHIMGYLLPYFQLFGLDKQDTGIIDEIKASVNHKYYEVDLINAVTDYLHTTHLHLLDGLSRIDDKGYMAKYQSPVPFRHPSTQHSGGTDHSRPAPICSQSNSVMRREMVHGHFEASIFDMDAICELSADEVKAVNNSALARVKDMGYYSSESLGKLLGNSVLMILHRATKSDIRICLQFRDGLY